ncbi:MAG: phosphoribosyltransferase family protein [Chthoniobacter sp.]|nr:phosphoribosyltransferase family protein [Chthoniobacter sp.]
MQNSRVSRPSGVVSFNSAAFDEACAALMRLVVQDGCPDALIGIRTGGLYVAQSMAKAAGYTVPVLTITCRRPSTEYKIRLSALKKVVTRLPRPIVDRLRMIEHAVLTRKPQSIQPSDFQFDANELVAFDDWLDRAGGRPSLVIVDDAIDSGATISRVLDLVSRRVPPATKIRSAVVTVTTPHPLILPDYTLFCQQLCRFPWSLDA